MSAEFLIPKITFKNVSTWVIAWTPYNMICFIGAFRNRMLITPTISQVGAFFAKLASAVNPVVAAISHPQYRQARQELSFVTGCKARPRARANEEKDTTFNDA